MPEPGPSAVGHLLVLGPPSTGSASGRAALLADVARLHEEGGRLDGVVVLGTTGDPADAKDLVLEIQLACLEQQYEVVVAVVPGEGDLRTMPARRLLARNLAAGWEAIAPDLWSGAMHDDIVQPLRTDVLPSFSEWADDVAEAMGDWHPGLLPGEGSLRWTVAAQTLGLVCVNTVFRMVAEDASADLAVCSAEQLDLAVGMPFADWAMANDLTVLLAGRSCALPGLPREAAPLLAVAARGERAVRGWTVPFEGEDATHVLVRLDLRADQPTITDTATGRQLPTAIRPSQATTARVPAARGPEEPHDPQVPLAEFYRYMSTGQMVLAVISGASDDIITIDELNLRLAETTFGSVPQSPPPLHETWAAARRVLSGPQLEQQLVALSVPSGHDGRTVHGLLRAPWSRVYDFTGSDSLPSVRDVHFRELVSLIDARRDYPSSKRNSLEAVALHGWPGRDNTHQDFGDAWSAPGRDARSLWFRRFRAEVLTRPVVFVSHSPSSPALWEALRIAGLTQGQHDFPAFLISPTGTPAEEARLDAVGVRHIRMAPADFVRGHLGAGHQALIEGRRVLSDEYEGTREGVGVVRVKHLVENAPAGSREFLIGRDPTWGDIMNKKIAAPLSLVDAIEERAQPREGGRLPIILVKGTAGSGKTTALMQVAYRLHKKGANVAWVDRGASLTRRDIEQQAHQRQFESIFVDDVDIFTNRAATLLQNLNHEGRNLVVAAIRVTRQSELDAGFPAEVVSSDQLLTDGDLEKIIKSLDKNALIGKLKRHFFMHQKVAKLREKCDQGLLAAMIEAVTGTSLPRKVKSEFEELSPQQRDPYAVVSFFDSSLIFQQRGIDEADLLEVVAHPDAPNHGHRAAIQELVAMNLLIRTGEGRLRCRQRTIADTVVETVLQDRKDDLAWIIAQLLLFYAGRAWHITDNGHRDRSVMIKLLNHDTMRRLGLTAEAVRDIYGTAHDFLENDHHYWLQRAEYEAEQGRLDLAKNHLAAAKECPDGADDRLVITADARVRLRSSMRMPADASLIRAAVHAVQELSSVTVKYRRHAPHTFVVLTREGTRWLERCGGRLTPQEYEEALDKITAGIALGRSCCPENHQVGRAIDECGPKLRELRRKGPGIPI
ncbi:hypothetical protein ACN2WE_30105 [Streptomyces sp. cg28]|uniref:P-loop NTPase n=1 Tax=Streptomyces sp. cg28 TaxID=3403457 RepID=UPI003B21A40F